MRARVHIFRACVHTTKQIKNCQSYDTNLHVLHLVKEKVKSAVEPVREYVSVYMHTHRK